MTPILTTNEPIEKLTDAEIEAFDQATRQHFEQSLRLSRALRLAQHKETDPQPGSPEAEAAVREAIKQGAE